ncbi:DUF3857 domain-containing protein [Flammeovirga sp. EKP202]|uniref:DUF3857 domain-containing protein n=1 Tax=Flammeovirga sp. EKP202 TaxID=2770592 RepID=UPI00165F372D|nr:DUF3857 domain-containing protein [Flammeovirga sp. EKP202]MBD0405033.1 DUF3857 domain-containing protein [Flammeovirga sp. EKP202]
MKKLALIGLMLMTTLRLYSQIVYSDARVNLTSDDELRSFQLTEDHASYEAVILKERRIMEYFFEYGRPSTLKTVHKLIHINSDAGIEKYNRVYVPMRKGASIRHLKVRAISPEGKITAIQRENIKELKNVEGFQNVKIFAIEGLEVGGKAEFLYSVKSSILPFGKEIMQTDVPILKTSLELVHPKAWDFKYKSYNGLNDAKFDLIAQKQKVIVLNQKDIPAFEEEEYATNRVNYMHFEYKIASNGGLEKNMFSWINLLKRMTMEYSSPKTAKVAKKYVSDILAQDLSDAEKLIALEHKIKSTIRLEKGVAEALYNPKSIVANGVGNFTGIYQLYIYCFDALDIKAQLVFGCNRYDGVIDSSFATVTSLNEMFFYFPNLKKYLLPEQYHMRFGTVHTGLMDTEAIFISYYVDYNKVYYKNYNFKKLKGLSYNLNQIGATVTIDFEDNLALPKVKLEDRAQGYRAFSYRSALKNADNKYRTQFIKDVTLSAFENFEVLSTDVEGEDMALSTNPENFVKINIEYTSPELVERAGNEYLISVGKVIGKQSELYQEKERQNDIVMHTIQKYRHKITINIPEGYQIEGLEEIKNKKTITVNGEEMAYFISDYQLKESSLLIAVDEVYKTFKFPKENYEEFREVINSAANFNQLTLIMTKKQGEL